MNEVKQYKFCGNEIKEILLEKIGIKEEHFHKINVRADVGRKKRMMSVLNEITVEIEEVKE